MSLMLLDEVAITESVEEKISFVQKWFESSRDFLIQTAINLVTALVIFIIGWWVIKLISKLFIKAMKKSKADMTVVTFLNSIITVALKIVLIICCIGTLGFDISTLIAAIGAAAVTVGLALKDSMANVASGTLIILNKKFKTGDFIETEGITGEVMHIDMMYTTLRTYDHKEVHIPNSRLTSNNVINHFSLEARRMEIPVPVSYHEDVERARKVITGVIKENKLVLQDRNNKVFIDKFNESSVDLIVWVWANSEDYWTVLFEMKEGIKSALDREGITIPFNQLDVHIDGAIGEPQPVIERK